jgi:hypothetical protein
MSPQEQRARAVVLAQALESADPQGRLLDTGQRERATQVALQAARASAGANGAQLPDADLVVLRAEALVRPAVAGNPALALLERPRPWWSWLAVAVPALALLLGIATDQIANPHRVDLLSVPLLAVIFWNLLTYLWLAVWLAAGLRRRPGHRPGRASFLAALRHGVHAWPGPWPDAWRGRRRGALSEVAALFYLHWHRLTEELTVYRWKKVLHLAAAAWGAGIALSLLGRGLVVEYRVGWESTFLQAQHVHAILEALFWPLTVLFSLAPFTVDEVAALRNFAAPGGAGDRWVFLYAGLLGLIVVLPRLGLAGWSAWRALSLSRAVRIDLDQPYYQELLGSLRPARITIGLVTGDARTDSQLLRLLRQSADDPLAPQLAITSAEGDQLRWIEEPGVGQPVDAVLRIPANTHPPRIPHAWESKPIAAPGLERLGQAWLQMPLIVDALRSSLPPSALPGLARVSSECERRHRLCFEQSMARIAAYLFNVARQLEGSMSADTLAQARDQLLLQLFELHRLDGAAGRALEEKLAQTYLAVAGPSGASAMGPPRTSAAGAAAGATMGGAVDLATAGLTLGAGTALGGLLGAGVGWAFAAWKKKELAGETMQALTQAALLLYLEVANSARVRPLADDPRAAWQKAIASAVKQQWRALAPLWSAARDGQGGGDAIRAPTGELTKVLAMTAQSLLDALYPR